MIKRPRILGLGFFLTSTLIFQANSQAGMQPYYGDKLPELLGSSHIARSGKVEKSFKLATRAASESSDIEQELYRVLSRYHVDQGNHPDQIVNVCPEKERCYNHEPLSYNEARKALFGHLHLVAAARGYSIRGVYCQKEFTSLNFPKGGGIGPGQIPNPNVMNTEHTWPQSHFSSRFPKFAQKSDLHALFPTQSRINSTRGNYRFSWVTDIRKRTCGDTKVGSGIDGGTYFEPPDEHKGNVARAIFYFSIRYKMYVDETEEDALREWHELDPVDSKELLRNEEIFALQNTRNPFIDYPELVDEIKDF